MQQLLELGAAHLYGAELAQVLGDELRIQQQEIAIDQPRGEIDQRHLAGVGLG
jgi:hypothetical protein